jgi:TnpA family transposase
MRRKNQKDLSQTTEALYVVDALCHHESDLHIQEHYTDTGGDKVM